MRLDTLALAALVFVVPSYAQYFSAGWTPGQAAPTTETPEPTSSSLGAESTPLPPPLQGQSRFDLSYILSSGPVSRFFNRFGVNITEGLEAARALPEIWDSRIPLVTDDNFNELIVNEELTDEEEKDRVWLLIITTSIQGSGVSLFADQQFDEAYNTTLIERDLPHVRWGRIDYMNVTHLTTKWAVWNAPVLVAVSDRGKSLRFWRASQIRLRAEALREYFKSGMWEHTPPWQSSFGPGGSREFVMEWQAIVMTKFYNIVRVLPRWTLYVISGVLGSFIMNLVHRGGKSDSAKTEPVSDNTRSTVTGSSTAVAPSATSATPAKGKGKRSKK
jgi:hypothetical protein